jgi:hypothetical protein
MNAFRASAVTIPNPANLPAATTTDTRYRQQPLPNEHRRIRRFSLAARRSR